MTEKYKTKWSELIDKSFRTQSEFCETLKMSRPTGDRIKHNPINMLDGKVSYLLGIMKASNKSSKEVLTILNESIKEVQDGGTN